MGIKHELGKRIKQLRLKHGYTQEKLSEILDISQRALSSIELGENFISSDTFDKLLLAFDVTADELLATNAFKTPNELIIKINENISKISNDSAKLEIVYNLTKSLSR